jgi:RNA polymerase sigma-70 factor (ECF subfamily)
MGKRGPQDIARGIKNGSQSSFGIFFRLKFDNLTHFIESYTHDHKQAEYLAQETFCAVWDKPATIDPTKDSFIISRKYGMTNREIAEKEGLTVKAVEYRIMISLRMFKEKLKDHLPLVLWWLLG